MIHMRAIIVVALCLGLTAGASGQQTKWTDLMEQEKKLHAEGKYSEAAAIAQEAMEEAKKTFGPKSSYVAASQNNLAENYRLLGKYSEAEPLYQSALEIWEKVFGKDHPDIVVIAVNNLALLYDRQGRYAEAEVLYNRAVETWENVLGKDHPRVGTALNNLAAFYDEQGKYGASGPLYERALEIQEKALGKDHPDVATTLNNLAGLHGSLGKHSQAESLSTRSLTIREKALGKDHPDVARSLDGLAFQQYSQGKYSEAEPLYEKGLEIRRKALGEEHPGVAGSLESLALVYGARGRYAQAELFCRRSLAILEKALGKDHPDVAKSLNSLAILCRRQGKYSEAEALYRRSLAIVQGALGKDHPNVAYSLGNLGVLYQNQGDRAEARRMLTACLDILRRNGLNTQWPQNFLAHLYLDQGDIVRAEQLIVNAGFLQTRARLALLKGNMHEATSYCEQIRKSAEENRDTDDLVFAYTGLGMAHEGLQDDIRSADYYRKAIDLTEDLRSILKRGDREKFLDAKIQGFSRTAPYEGLVRVLLRMNKPLGAFKVSEHCKARAFAEQISARGETSRSDIPSDVLKQDEAIRDQLGALKLATEEAYNKENQDSIEALEPRVAQLEEQFRQHLRMLRDRYPLFAAVKYPLPMDLSQTDLRPHEWVLEYVVTDTGVAVYLVKGKELVRALFKTIPRKELDSLVRSFRNPVEADADGMSLSKLENFDFVAGKRLAEILLGDVLGDLPSGNSLIVVPDDCLGVVPFEMLVLNAGGSVKTDRTLPYVVGAQFFGDRNQISYSQSITALTLARTLGKERKRGKKILAIVDPIFGTEDPRLTKIEEGKKQKLVASLPNGLLRSMSMDNGLEWPRLHLTAQLGRSLKDAQPESTDLYEGIDAKKTLLLERDLRPYRAMVLATHGYYGKHLSGIQEPVLVLTLVDQPSGQDGFLRLSEVMGLSMNCDVAALTACQSGLGHQISGEGTMGMGRAFQYAGARSVLMSLWSVADESSVMLVASFFKHMQAGKNRLEALKDARDEIRKAGYDHPFFWAPFILVGEVN